MNFLLRTCALVAFSFSLCLSSEMPDVWRCFIQSMSFAACTQWHMQRQSAGTGMIFAVRMSLLSSIGSKVHRLACGTSVLSSSHVQVQWFCVQLRSIAGASVFVAEDSTSKKV